VKVDEVQDWRVEGIDGEKSVSKTTRLYPKNAMYQQDLTITVNGEWRKKEVQSRHELATYRDVLMSPFK
jgi:hypothetical protein